MSISREESQQRLARFIRRTLVLSHSPSSAAEPPSGLPAFPKREPLWRVARLYLAHGPTLARVRTMGGGFHGLLALVRERKVIRLAKTLLQRVHYGALRRAESVEG